MDCTWRFRRPPGGSDLGRLTQASFTPEGQSAEVYTYTYDAVGNRTSWNSTTYTYDAADQLTSDGSISFGYDANGNQVSRGSDDFEWDHENRLTEATIGSTTWSHEYNGDGLRMSRGDGTTTVGYVWDVAGGLPMLLQDGTHTYVYGLGLIAIYDGSEMTYRLVDGLGSTVNLCDQNGDLIGEYTYDAYGNVRSQTEFSFAGEQNDPNGLDFLRARYYDPEIGRFLSGDPLGGGYGYAAGNPVNLVDPSGMVPAGTCLTMNNATHLLVPCGASDAEALVGDRWYNDYLAGMQAWSESTGRGDAALTALLVEAFAPPDPADLVAETAFSEAVAAPPPPPASILDHYGCNVRAHLPHPGTRPAGFIRQHSEVSGCPAGTVVHVLSIMFTSALPVDLDVLARVTTEDSFLRTTVQTPCTGGTQVITVMTFFFTIFPNGSWDGTALKNGPYKIAC